MPKTYRTVGKIRFINGQAFPGGIITLTSTADSRIVMEAPVADDGSFELSMMHGDHRLVGAMNGTYQVMVSSRFSGRNAVQTYVLPSLCSIEPKENNLIFEVDPAMVKR
jgi:hypothetical protein